MGDTTQLVATDMRAVLSGYNLGSYQSHQTFHKGADQTNLRVVTDMGSYVFRYYEKRSTDYILFELDLLRYLARHEFISPSPIPHSGGHLLSMYKGKPYAMFEFLSGAHSDDRQNRALVAGAIGRLHDLTIDIKPEHADARDTYDIVSCLRSAQASAKRMPATAEARLRLEWLRHETDTIRFSPAMPKGAIHGDANPANFLFEHGEVSAVLDFDQASYAYLLYDLASLLYWWAWPDKGELDIGAAREVIEGYQAYRRLTPEEKQQLFDMLKMPILMDVAWFIDHDQDFLNAQRKIELLNQLGLEEFCRKLFYDA